MCIYIFSTMILNSYARTTSGGIHEYGICRLMHMWHDPFLCDVTTTRRSYAWQDKEPYSYVWHDRRALETWLVSCHAYESCSQRALETWLVSRTRFIGVARPTNTLSCVWRDSLYVWQDSFEGVTLLSHMWHGWYILMTTKLLLIVRLRLAFEEGAVPVHRFWSTGLRYN